MKIINESSPQVEDNPHAPVKNPTVPVGAFNEGFDESGGEEKTPSFSRTLARKIQAAKGEKAKHGAHESLVLKYLAHRAKNAKRKDGRKGFYMTVRDIAEVFPYLGATTIWEIVCRLKKLDLLIVTNQNHRRYDRTFWFDVSQEMRDAVEDDIIYFDVSAALLVGVPAALVLRNFEYWCNRAREEGKPEEIHMSPAKLSRVLPFSEDTIKRALEDLVEAHRLIKLSDTKPIYQKAAKVEGANPNNEGANPNKKGAYPNRKGANPNNNTPYVTISNLFETSSKASPSAPCDFVKETNEDTRLSKTNKACPSMNPDTDGLVPPVHSAKGSPCPTPDVSGEALDMPGCENLDQLHLATSVYATIVEQGKMEEILRSKATEVCDAFFSTLTRSEVVSFDGCTDHGWIFVRLSKRFQSFFKAYGASDVSKDVVDVLFKGCLECIVGALLYRKQREDYRHGITCLRVVTYRLYIKIDGVLDEDNAQQTQEWLKQRRVEFASPDEVKETNTDLTPAGKARIFFRGIESRNEVGWIYMNSEHRQNLIAVNRAAKTQAQKLFALNLHLTPAHLLHVVDSAMTKFTSRPMPKEYEKLYWDFKRLSDVCHLINSLEHVVSFLKISHELPAIAYLSEGAGEDERAKAA